MMRDIHEAILDLKPGTFNRFGFFSEVPIRADRREFCDGYRIIKVTEMTTRTGINYGSLIKESSSSTNLRANNFSPVIRNKVSYNSNTGKEYLNLFPTKLKNNSTKVYVVLLDSDNREVSRYYDLMTCGLEELTTHSYFKKLTEPSNNIPKMLRVSLENVYKINNEMW